MKNNLNELPLRIKLNAWFGGFATSRQGLIKIEAFFFITTIVLFIVWLSSFVLTYPPSPIFQQSNIGDLGNLLGLISVTQLLVAYCACYSVRVGDQYNIWSTKA